MKTLYEHLKDYIDYRTSLNYSEMSLKEYYYDCNSFLRYLNENFEVTEAADLSTKHLYMYQRHLGSIKKIKGLPLKARTINKQVCSVNGLLKFMAKRGIIQRSLTEILLNVKEPKMLPLDVFPYEQIKRALSKIDTSHPEGYRDRAMLELLYTTGMRASEISGLDTNKIDLKYGTAAVFGKGRKERIVPIGKTALKYLETYIKAVRCFLVKDPAETALFLHSKGKRLQRHTLLKIVHKHCDNAGFDINVTPHTFRRSCTTELIRENANLYHVKDMLGHESLDTLKHYTKLTITDLKKTHSKCHPRERDK